MSTTDRPEEGIPLCPACRADLIFEVYPGYEHNEWRAHCPVHGSVHVDEAQFRPHERVSCPQNAPTTKEAA